MAKPPAGRPPTDEEREAFRIDGEWSITAPADRTYNCFGWAIASGMAMIGPKEHPIETGTQYLERMGWAQVPRPPARGTVTAIYQLHHDGKPAHWRGAWHVAKRVNRDWWESKLNTGPRVVHRLDALGRIYGKVASFHVPDEKRTFSAALCSPLILSLLDGEISDYGIPRGRAIEELILEAVAARQEQRRSNKPTKWIHAMKVRRYE